VTSHLQSLGSFIVIQFTQSQHSMGHGRNVILILNYSASSGTRQLHWMQFVILLNDQSAGKQQPLPHRGPWTDGHSISWPPDASQSSQIAHSHVSACKTHGAPTAGVVIDTKVSVLCYKNPTFFPRRQPSLRADVVPVAPLAGMKLHLVQDFVGLWPCLWPM
jgi:hypothetical protein